MLEKHTLFPACLFAAMLSNVLAATNPQCYFPAGNLATDYAPCNSTSSSAQSSCCHLADSVCTENGYCVGSNGLFYRGGCTDSTFVSPSCPQLCKNDFSNTFSTFFNCADAGTYSQTWCCATGSADSCCGSGFAVDFGNPFQPNATQTVTIVASGTADATSTALAGISSNSAATATSSSAASTGSSGNKNGTIIGVGVGVGLGVGLLAVAAVVYTIFTQRNKRRLAETKLEEKTREFDTGTEMFEQKAAALAASKSDAGVVEMEALTLAAKHTSELAAARTRYELDLS